MFVKKINIWKVLPPLLSPPFLIPHTLSSLLIFQINKNAKKKPHTEGAIMHFFFKILRSKFFRNMSDRNEHLTQ